MRNVSKVFNIVHLILCQKLGVLLVIYSIWRWKHWMQESVELHVAQTDFMWIIQLKRVISIHNQESLGLKITHLSAILWSDVWTKFHQHLEKPFKSISMKFWILNSISWPNHHFKYINGQFLKIGNATILPINISWVRLLIHYMALILKELETGMKNTKLLKIFQKTTWLLEHKETVLFKRFITIFSRQQPKVLLQWWKEAWHLWIQTSQKSLKYLSITTFSSVMQSMSWKISKIWHHLKITPVGHKPIMIWLV